MLSDASDLLQDTDIEKVPGRLHDAATVNKLTSDLRIISLFLPLSSPVACQPACRGTPGAWSTAL